MPLANLPLLPEPTAVGAAKAGPPKAGWEPRRGNKNTPSTTVVRNYDDIITTLARRPPAGGGGGNAGERLAKLESDVGYIKRDIGEIKTAIKEIRVDMRTDFRLLFGTLIVAILGLSAKVVSDRGASGNRGRRDRLGHQTLC